MNVISTKYNFSFWIHLFLTMLSWFLPFLFDWRLDVTAYSIVLLQFAIFNACLMNRQHALDDKEHDTFYAHLLEIVGIHLDRRKVKVFVRFWIYILMGAIAVIWQVVLGKEPLIF